MNDAISGSVAKNIRGSYDSLIMEKFSEKMLEKYGKPV